MSVAGRKKGIFGFDRAKGGRPHLPGGLSTDISVTKSFGINATGVSGSDQCYEPAGARFVVDSEAGATILKRISRIRDLRFRM
jgi:hypothetical protein